MINALKASPSERTKWIARRDRVRRATWARISISLSEKAQTVVDYVRDMQESSASEAINYLILRTEPREPRLKRVDSLLVFDCDDDGPPITTEEVLRIQLEEGLFPRKAQKPTPPRVSVRISSEALAVVERHRQAVAETRSRAICELITRSA